VGVIGLERPLDGAGVVGRRPELRRDIWKRLAELLDRLADHPVPAEVEDLLADDSEVVLNVMPAGGPDCRERFGLVIQQGRRSGRDADPGDEGDRADDADQRQPDELSRQAQTSHNSQHHR
jgi:hypothetical protein